MTQRALHATATAAVAFVFAAHGIAAQQSIDPLPTRVTLEEVLLLLSERSPRVGRRQPRRAFMTPTWPKRARKMARVKQLEMTRLAEEDVIAAAGLDAPPVP